MSTYENIDPAAVAENEVLMAAILEADYNVDASLGTVERELVIRPNAAMAAYNDEKLSEFRQEMTLSTAASNPDVSDEAVDALASNFRLVRKDGQVASGMLAIYTDQTGNVVIGSNTTFNVSGMVLAVSKVYIGYLSDAPAEDTADVVYRKMVKSFDGTYVFTIPVQSAEPSGETISPRTAVVINPANSKVAQVLVASAITGGSTEESNEDLLARAATGVTAAVPSGKVHIDALLKRDLEDVTVYSTAVFGMGDPEVLRDRYNISGISMGGRVDIYARTSPLVSQLELIKTATLSTDGRWTFQIAAQEAPGFYGVSSIIPGDNSGISPISEDIEYVFGMDTTDPLMPDIQDPVYSRFSSYQTATVSFPYEVQGAVAGNTLDFNVSVAYMPSIDIIQAYLNQRDRANTAQDCLVKAPIASSVSVAARVTYPPGVTVVDVGILQQAVAQSINDLSVGQRYLTADEICLSINAVDEKLRVDFPVVMSSSTFLIDGSVKNLRSDTGHLDMYTDVDQGITERNTCFFCDAVNVEINLQERVTES